MSEFVLQNYDFEPSTGTATFRYSVNGFDFTETAQYQPVQEYDAARLDNALFLAFVLIGTSYFKTFPTPAVRFAHHPIDQWQADFFNKVYQEGLSQFAYENQLTRADLAQFHATGEVPAGGAYRGKGILSLQSGGKDSLLVATLLKQSQKDFTSWYISSSDHHPAVLDDLGAPLVVIRRHIDKEALVAAAHAGARNGHVPVTYIVQSLALIQAILENKNEILTAIGHEGEEPHAVIGDLSVTHQWSKTWQAEQLFAEYVARYVSPDIHVGSPLRGLSELRIAELFVQNCWQAYGHSFSSCNVANYKQGSDNSHLHWCGECPKCANSYLLFAPFLDAAELQSLFAGQDLFEKPLLQQTFKGLLGVDDVMKPFECIGEVDELRYAYHLAQKKGGYAQVSFAVPEAAFDYLRRYPQQDWAQL